ncbi:MAG: RND family transporter [Gemmatimonadota bacterium]
MIHVPRPTRHHLLLRACTACFKEIPKHYALVLLGALAASVVGAIFSAKLKLRSDLAELLPDSYESVRALNEMKARVGGIGQLRVVLAGDDFPALESFAQALEPRLLASEYVGLVDYRNDLDFFERNALLYLDASELDSLEAAIRRRIDREKEKLNPLLVEDLFGDESAEEEPDELADWEAKYREKEPKPLYTNADSTVLVLKLFPSRSSTDLAFDRAMLNDVRAIVGETRAAEPDPPIQVFYGGNIKNRLDELQAVKHDILGTLIFGVSGVFLLLVLYFRRIVAAIVISLSLLFSLSWTFGLTYLVIGELNTITGFMFVILFGLGIDYGIHGFARYVESRQAGLGLRESLDKMVFNTGTALATTALTTSAAFFTLMLMDFRGFSELGFIAGAGILFAFLSMVVVLPAFIVFTERVGLMRIRPAEGATGAWHRKRFRYSGTILAVASTLTVLGAIGLSRVGFEYDFTNLRIITPERRMVSEKTEGVFSRSESPAVVLTDSRKEAEAVMDVVRRRRDADSVTPTISSVRSIYSLVPDDQPAKLRKIRRIRDLVEEEAVGVVTGEDEQRLEKLRRYLRVDSPFTLEDVPMKEKRAFVEKDGRLGSFVFIYPGVPLRDGRNAIEFRNDVGTITTESGKVFHATSSNIITAEMLILMVSEGKTALLLTFIVVFLIVMADFRSLKAALLVLSPLLIGIVWMGGAMHVLGLKWNFFNIVVLPSILGIGVDNGVHIYHRYLEEGPGSLYHVLRNTGLAISMTTLTTIAGYAGLITATHPGLVSMGVLAVMGLSAAFLTTVIVLPALIHVFAGGRERPVPAV